jgi:hypothetical protein
MNNKEWKQQSLNWFLGGRPDRSDEQVRFRTASPLVNITDEDINRGIGVALSAGPGSLKGEILPPSRPVAVRAIEGPSDAHPLWATSYLPGGQIVYSRGNVALRQRVGPDGIPYYTGIKNFGDQVGGTAYDIRTPVKGSQAFSEDEARELGDIANRIDQKYKIIEGR